MIRAIETTDAAAVWDIFVRSLGYDTTPEMVAARIEALAEDPRCISLVAADDATGQVVGFVHALRYDTLHNAGGWDVISLAVAPESQGAGVGSALLQAVETQAAACGDTFVRLNSRVERTAAHGFYEHRGYLCPKQQKYFVKRLA